MKIISGGQTGADRAGLTAAKKLGFATGGWMPKGFKAHDGYHPKFAELYGIQEHNSPTYPPRTFQNAHESDGTVRFAIDFTTSGEQCTLNAIKKFKKPYFDVDIVGDEPIDSIVEKFIAWLTDNNISVLNVAGNSEKTCQGISEFVEMFLIKAFKPEPHT